VVYEKMSFTQNMVVWGMWELLLGVKDENGGGAFRI